MRAVVVPEPGRMESTDAPVDDIEAGFDFVRKKQATEVVIRIAQEDHIG